MNMKLKAARCDKFDQLQSVKLVLVQKFTKKMVRFSPIRFVFGQNPNHKMKDEQENNGESERIKESNY